MKKTVVALASSPLINVTSATAAAIKDFGFMEPPKIIVTTPDAHFDPY